jgi:hypothetical protein
MSVIEFKCARKHKRFQPSENIDLYISVIYAGKSTNKVKAKLRDISESGLGVFSTTVLNNDSQVMIDFLFGNTRITTSAQIIYSKELSLGHATGISVGESAKPIMEFIKAMGIDLNKV